MSIRKVKSVSNFEFKQYCELSVKCILRIFEINFRINLMQENLTSQYKGVPYLLN